MAQNRKFEMEQDRKVRQVALDAAEKDGSRVRASTARCDAPMSGKDQSSARLRDGGGAGRDDRTCRRTTSRAAPG
ncbi:MAG: hypothetical protein R2712_13800 [Vicinamibacterales bacterium]